MLYAKTREELLNAPLEIQWAMTEFTDYYEASSELRDDIAARFPYPSLWAAVDRLVHFVEEETKARMALERSGYTFNDVFAYRE